MRISDWSSDVCSSDLPTTNLAIAKTSGIVSDPVNGTTNAKAIPGARMRYCILVTNNGSGTATGIAIADPLPAGTSFVPGSLSSGASCPGAATAEDANASGAAENEPFGASGPDTGHAPPTPKPPPPPP